MCARACVLGGGPNFLTNLRLTKEALSYSACKALLIVAPYYSPAVLEKTLSHCCTNFNESASRFAGGLGWNLLMSVCIKLVFFFFFLRSITEPGRNLVFRL